MDLTPELLKCIAAFLMLANTIASCVLQRLRNKATKK
jgi:hypothetical protein